jgi:Fe-S oxidoreductase/FAD/FMN-containing dehydrogenase
MKNLLSIQTQEELQNFFGKRIRTNDAERIVYSHDMGVIPEQIRKIFNNIPDGIVQPESREDIIKLMEIAQIENIPLIPRGSGTAGFGGSIPTKGGIVVDMVRMNKILEIDASKKTCKVESGTIWANIEKEIVKQGLALRLFPSSARSSTVGGWAAQGGSGYGSYEHGKFRDNISEVELLRPDNKIVKLSGDELDYVYSLCGITGIILSITFHLREISNETVFLASFTKATEATKFLNLLDEDKTPLWNVSFSTPSFINLKQLASGHTLLDDSKYHITMVTSSEKAELVLPKIKEFLELSNGELLPSDLAKAEWGDKFYPMRFKKLGPTLIASEVINPIKDLDKLISQIEKKYKGKFALEGTMVGSGHIALLGFMLSDERKFGFPLAYANSLDVMKMGENFGGIPFSIGMYFNDKSEKVYGKDKLKNIWSYKQSVDPTGIMNPGKIIPSSMDKKSPIKLLGTAMRMANSNRKLVGLAGLLLTNAQGDRFSSPLNENVTRDTFNCALCGYCRDVCTVYDASPWESNSPRGKYYLSNQLIKGKISMTEEMARIFSICATCKKCDGVCQVDSNNTFNWMELRFDLKEKDMENTGLAAIRKNVIDTGNFWGISKKDKTQWIDVPYQEKGKVAYWSGCWASTVTDNMAKSMTRILNKAGQEFVWFGEQENCCGLYLALGGYKEDFENKVRENLALFIEREVETVVCSCPGCYAFFSENYKKMAEEMNIPCNVKFKHSTVFLNELNNAGKLPLDANLPLKVTYHDSCHTGRWFGHYEEPRELIKSIPGIELNEMELNRENASCCGLVSVFDDRETVQHTAVRRINEAEKTGAELLVTNCAGCAAQFNTCSNAMNTKVKQIGIAELVSRAMDLPTEDNSEKILGFMQNAMELLHDSQVICSAAASVLQKK